MTHSEFRFTWTELEYLVQRTSLPVMVKGTTRAEDAVRALECGVQGVYVSNHGGRSINGGLSTIETLPTVVSAVNQRCDIIIDGDFTHDSDVIKALAIGAKAAAIGHLQCWALALGGAPSLTYLFSILGQEIETTMALMGCRSIGEVTADFARLSYPTQL